MDSFNPYQQQYGQIDRKRALAEALIGQSLAPQQNQNGFTALARILATKLSNDRVSSLDAEEKALTDQYKTEQKNTFDQFSQTLQGKPAVVPFSNETPYPAMPKDAVPGDKNKAMGVLLGSNNPTFQQAALAEMLKGPQYTKLGAGDQLLDNSGNVVATNTKNANDFRGKYNPGDYTVDSWATFASSGNPEDLVRHESKPSAIQEWDLFMSLPEDQQEQYLGLKRALQIEKVGGSPSIVKPGGSVVPLSTPDQEADAAAKIAGAVQGAKSEAENKANEDANAPKMEQRRQALIAGIDNTLSSIDQAINQTGFFETGITGKVLGNIPGTDSYNLGRIIDTIKANIGFDRLQQMRDASPTGGALGQVAIQELNALQASVASMDQGQDADVLVDNLKKIKRHYERWKKAVGGQSVGSTGEWSQNIDDLVKKYAN